MFISAIPYSPANKFKLNLLCLFFSIKTPKDFNLLVKEILSKIYVFDKDITYVEKNIFSYSYNIKFVIIPNGVETICNNAFLICINLEKVILPETIKYIGAYAFYGCSKLKIINLNKNKLIYLGYNAFYGCKKPLFIK